MASLGLNRATLLGHIGSDPEVREINSGSKVCNLSIATTESWKDKKSGEMQEKTEWHRLVFYNRMAEIAGSYIHKGSHLYVEGRLQTNEWVDKEGITRYTTEIVVQQIRMLDKSSTKKQDDPYYHPTQQPSGNANAKAPPDDDIPF